MVCLRLKQPFLRDKHRNPKYEFNKNATAIENNGIVNAN